MRWTVHPGSRHGLSVEFHAISNLDASFVQAWNHLAEHALEPNPFFSPQMLIPAARWLPGGKSVHLAVVRRRSELLAMLPLVQGRYRRMAMKADLAWRHPHLYVGTPLLSIDQAEGAPSVLLRELARWSARRWLVLEQLYVDGAVAEAFRTAAADLAMSWVLHDCWERPMVRAREEESYLKETLSAKSAKELRRRRRNLERDHGTVRSRDVATQGQPMVDAQVDAFLLMEAAGWKGRAGTALSSDPSHAAFWRDACHNLQQAGLLELWQLVAGQHVAAQQCHVRQREVVFHLKTTYDENLARYSPGVQLELDVLHAFHLDKGIRLLDPCTGREPSVSSRLYPDSRTVGDVLVGFDMLGRTISRLTPAAATLWRKLPRRPALSLTRGLSATGDEPPRL